MICKMINFVILFFLGDWYTIKLDIPGGDFVNWAKMDNILAIFRQKVAMFKAT